MSERTRPVWTTRYHVQIRQFNFQLREYVAHDVERRRSRRRLLACASLACVSGKRPSCVGAVNSRTFRESYEEKGPGDLALREPGLLCPLCKIQINYSDKYATSAGVPAFRCRPITIALNYGEIIRSTRENISLPSPPFPISTFAKTYASPRVHKAARALAAWRSIILGTLFR